MALKRPAHLVLGRWTPVQSYTLHRTLADLYGWFALMRDAHDFKMAAAPLLIKARKGTNDWRPGPGVDGFVWLECHAKIEVIGTFVDSRGWLSRET